MKRICYLLLLAVLTGCGMSAGDAGRKLGSGVDKCCTSLSLGQANSDNANESDDQDNTVVSSSLLDRSGKILTW
jgi:hypothetical protein